MYQTWSIYPLACFLALALTFDGSSAQPAIDVKSVLQICEAFSNKAPDQMPAIVQPEAAKKVIEDYSAFSDRLQGCLGAAESNRDPNSATFLIQNIRYESSWKFTTDDRYIKDISIPQFRPVTLADDEPWETPFPKTGLVIVPRVSIDIINVPAAETHSHLRELTQLSTEDVEKRVKQASDVDVAIQELGKAVSRAAHDIDYVIEKPVPESEIDKNIVDFFYATNRKASDEPVKLEGSPPPASSIGGQRVYISNGWTAISDYTGERNPNLSVGVIRVHVPEGHHIGNIELPQDLKLFGFKLRTSMLDPAKHFAIRSIESADEETWIKSLASTNKKKALVFVHGFNTKFRDAAFRAAQITWDLQFKGTTVLFSWPSRGDIADYFYDKDSALGSRTAFLHVVDDLYKAGYDDIDVIAHSMGNLIAVDALSNSAATKTPTTIAQLIMAAPDVDRDMFIQDMSGVAKVTKGLTLYASKNDEALQLSKRIAGDIPRAGDVPDSGPVVLPGVWTIDVSLVGNELFGLNHSTYATTRNVLNDLGILLEEGKQPPRLPEIRGYPEPPEKAIYFRYAP